TLMQCQAVPLVSPTPLTVWRCGPSSKLGLFFARWPMGHLFREPARAHRHPQPFARRSRVIGSARADAPDRDAQCTGAANAACTFSSAWTLLERGRANHFVTSGEHIPGPSGESDMMRLGAAFVAICMVLIAGALGAILYLWAGLSGVEASVVAIAVLM